MSSYGHFLLAYNSICAAGELGLWVYSGDPFMACMFALNALVVFVVAVDVSVRTA